MIIKVTELNTPELEIYAARNESMLKRRYEPEPGLFIAETANVVMRAIEAGYSAESLLVDERYLINEIEEITEYDSYSIKEEKNSTLRIKKLVGKIIERIGDVPVYSTDLDTMKNICGFKQTQGVLCAMKRREYTSLKEVLDGARRVAILENIENPTNVGAIFRSAAAIGIDAVILTFRSSDPLYRRASRVSMGTVFQIPWTFVGNKRGGWPEPGMDELKKLGFRTVSMALSDKALSLDAPILKAEEKIAILFGNEENGLMEETLEKSDYIAMIPMKHDVDSLNVAAASAVTFWELTR